MELLVHFKKQKQKRSRWFTIPKGMVQLRKILVVLTTKTRGGGGGQLLKSPKMARKMAKSGQRTAKKYLPRVWPTTNYFKNLNRGLTNY